MNAAHVHLVLNHLPIAGILFGFILLVCAIFRKREEWVKAAWFLFILSALFLIPTYLSGEGAEHIIEKLPGSEFIEAHEEVALYGLIMGIVLGGVSLLMWISTRRYGVARWMINVALVLSMLTTAILSYTALLGGQIRHPEIREDLKFG